MSKTGMACYRDGGCGPYEMYSCSECPASKSDYVQFKTKQKSITNYDIIVSKTPYELADWIARILVHCDNKMPNELCRHSCPLYKCCNDQPSDNIEDWLKAPADEEGE